ncbi:MAG TPA: PBP1A family penicillin-binding protein [Chthoniobacterales bacterium]|nr:PBP1A family penicillin-binding protein [Chthoniobacterales bacterium]
MIFKIHSLRRVLLWLALSGALCLGVLAIFYFLWSQAFDLKDIGKIPERSSVYDMDGKLYSRLQGENRVLIESGKIPRLFKLALLAREDSRFYEHHGIDPVGIARAIMRDVVHLGIHEGGSTITQQLARNSFTLGGRTLNRKILEAFIALRIESSFTKDQILEYYANRIYFGSGVYGLETASQTYFGKSSADLSLSEAAMLAGLIRSPNRYSPRTNLEGAVTQRDQVLDRMAELKLISTSQAAAAKNAPVNLANKRITTAQENYAMDAIYRELQGLVSQDAIDSGGLRVYTSLDPELQHAAEEATNNELAQAEKKANYRHPKKSEFTDQSRTAEEQPPYLQGAVFAMDNRTGAVRALVGGRDYRESKYNRALQAYRQVGSLFKPFIYAAAFARGMMPGTAIDDGPLRRGEVSAAPNWHPENSDHSNRGVLPARDGLLYSRNTMTVRVGELATLDRVISMGQATGFARTIPHFPASYLGAFESDLRDVTAAYSAFAAHGNRCEPYLIERIDDVDGNVVYQRHPSTKQVIAPAIAWMIAQTLRGVVERGTAASAQSLGLTRYAAGKTGTTDDYKDAWFVGFTNSLTCGVWAGFDQPQSIEENAYGATLALPIWVKVMEKASRKKYPDGPFPPPEPLVHVKLCSISNRLATDACDAAGDSYDITLPQSVGPTESCPVHGPRQFGESGESQLPSNRSESFTGRLFRSLRHLFGG